MGALKVESPKSKNKNWFCFIFTFLPPFLGRPKCSKKKCSKIMFDMLIRCKNTCRTRIWYDLIWFTAWKFKNTISLKFLFRKNHVFTYIFKVVKYVCPFRSEYFFTLYNMKRTELLTYSLKNSKNIFWNFWIFVFLHIFYFLMILAPGRGHK